MRRIAFMCLLLALCLGLPRLASAHMLQVDGDIGVTVHVDPDDDPVAGTPAQFQISLQDRTNQLVPETASACECTLTIKQKDTTLETLPILLSGVQARVPYTFPEAGSYSVVVAGVPREDARFQAFSTVFSYYVRAGNTTAAVQPQGNPLRQKIPLVIFGAAAILLVMWLAPRRKSSERS